MKLVTGRILTELITWEYFQAHFWAWKKYLKQKNIIYRDERHLYREKERMFY